MHIRPVYQGSEKQERLIRKAVRLEQVSLLAQSLVVVVIFLTMGSSQAMKAAWVEDILSLVPPVAFLISSRYRHRKPNEDYPYGYHRADSISFLVAATALSGFGLYILFDSVMKLVMAEHPTIGLMNLFGREVWSGWVMCAALAVTALAPMILGHMKFQTAKALDDKTLYTDGDMNKADWQTAIAGILGITGIGLGFWWADGLAGTLISLSICRDGFKNMKDVIEVLLDHRPTVIGTGEPHDLPQRIARTLRAESWVLDAAARVREEGRLFCSEVFVTPRSNENLTENLEAARKLVQSLDERLYDVVISPRPLHES